MDEEKFWGSFERTMRILEAIGLLLLVAGPVVGIILLFVGDMAIRMIGIAVLFGSGLLALYHFSFAHVMGALRRMFTGRESGGEGI